jgi:hypothetical protein
MMRSLVLMVLLNMVGLLCAVAGYAVPSSCCDIPEPITNCDCACTLPRGALSAKYLWEQGTSSQLLLNGHPIANPMAMRMRMCTQQVELSYGIRDDLQLCTVVPYVDNVMDMTMLGMTSASHAEGIGDVTALVKYRSKTCVSYYLGFLLADDLGCWMVGCGVIRRLMA